MSVELSEYSEKAQQSAFNRYNIIKPYLENNITLKEISNKEKISYTTLKRWIKNYRLNGIIGLLNKKRSSSNFQNIDKELKLFIEGLALKKPKPSIASIHRKVEEVAKKNNLNVPSYSTVHRIIKNIPSKLTTLAQDGTKAYKDEYDLLYPRKSNYPNEIWQADHTLMNIWILNEKGKPQRPWLTIIIDDYSRAIMGYFITFNEPNVQNTSLALHQAIWYKKEQNWAVCGIPETFYTDHGSDFTSLHLQQVSSDIKMNLSFSSVGQPRGRGIVERFFSTINQLFLSELPGYTDDGKKPKNLSTINIHELEELFRKFILDQYNYSIHSETKEIPIERWKKGNFIPRMPESLEELDLLLLTESKSRKVHQDGIHFHRIKYIEPTLAAYVGEQVAIRYDPRDIAEIRIFHQGIFICRAISHELAGKTIGLKDIIKARNKGKDDLKKELSERQDIVEKFFNMHYEKNNENTNVNEKNIPPKRKLKRYFHE